MYQVRELDVAITYEQPDSDPKITYISQQVSGPDTVQVTLNTAKTIYIPFIAEGSVNGIHNGFAQHFGPGEFTLTLRVFNPNSIQESATFNFYTLDTDTYIGHFQMKPGEWAFSSSEIALPVKKFTIRSEREYMPLRAFLDDGTTLALEQFFPDDFKVIEYIMEEARTTILVEIPGRYMRESDLDISSLVGQGVGAVKAVGLVKIAG
jgi:hypothetical protein